MFKRTVISILVTLFVFFAVGSQAFATQYYVDSDGDSSDGLSWATAFTSIQTALNTVPAGSVIDVNVGTYNGAIDFGGKVCTLRSTDPNDWAVVAATIIDANSDANVVTFENAEDYNSVITGFTIIGGDHGVVLDNSSSPVINRCIITGNDSYGIYCIDGSPEISNCKIYSNEKSGVYSQSPQPAVIKNNWIYENNKGVEIVEAEGVGQIINNTVVCNIEEGISVSGVKQAVINTILWANGSDDIENFTASYSCIDPHLIGWWKLDEGSGYTAYDLSGHGNNGSITNGSWITGGGINFDSDGYITIPATALSSLNNEVTIALWQYGDAITQPRQDVAFRADNENGRVLNIHVPWSSGKVYWDAGNDASGYDRIYRTAGSGDYKGRWNHWIFTKDAQAGLMKIYLNGKLWHQQNNKTKTMEGATSFKICANPEGINGYDGAVQDVRVYDTVLTDLQIREIITNEPTLEGRWNFDDATASDSSGNGRNGVLQGNASIVTDAQRGYCLQLDGSGDYVNITGYKGISGSSSRTVCAWVKPTGGNATVISWGNDVDGQMWQMKTTDIYQVRQKVHGGTRIGTASVGDGQWHHIAVVLEDDGECNVNKARIYVDGVQDSYSSTVGEPVNTSDYYDVKIGCWENTEYFEGLIDDVRIYNKALTESQISHIAGIDTSTRLQAYWNFDNIDANDSSGNGHNGTLIGNASIVNDTQRGYCLQLDGSGDYVNVDGYNGIIGTTSRTVCAWVKPDASDSTVISWGHDNSGQRWQVTVDGDNARLKVNDGTRIGATDIIDGQWHHVAIVMEDDGYPETNKVNIYVDGIKDNISSTVEASINTVSDCNVMIGSWLNGDYFDGRIDDVRIYSAALNGQQIRYIAGLPVEPNLCGSWKFDEAVGSLAFDSSGNGATGVLHGNTLWTEGKEAKALEFTGNGDYVVVDKDIDASLQGDITISAWINPDSLSGLNAVAAKEGSFALDVNDGKLQFTANYVHDVDMGISAGIWQHVAIVFAAGDIVKFYKNGLLYDSITASGIYDSNNSLLIGTDSTGNDFIGKIDDLRVYQSVLTDDQITEITGDFGNISNDPVFVDALGNDFHIAIDSPCYNTGEPNNYYDNQFDIDNELRLRAGRVDVGADESAPIWYVDVNAVGTEDGLSWVNAFTSIQDGIDAAGDGDVVLVAEGVYYGNIDFNGKAITVTSVNPNDSAVVNSTIIDAQGLSASAVRFISEEGPESILTGFTVCNGDNMDIIFSDNVQAVVTNCLIIDSVVGIDIRKASPIIKNCIIANNYWGVRNDGGPSSGFPSIINCNIVYNSFGIRNGVPSGSEYIPGDPTIKNCILWGNNWYDEELGLWNYFDLFMCEATYSCTWRNSPGTGNINISPYFVDASAGDYHLLGYSPCIDAGDPNSDFSKEPNGGGGRVNIGAYGNTAKATLTNVIDNDTDGLPDDWEAKYWLIGWYGPNDDVDNDGLTNLEEYLLGTNPANDDTDGDGYTDMTEQLHYSNPLYSNSVPRVKRTITVPTDVASIQQAIDVSVDGDTIEVSPGTYYETIDFRNKSITVESTGDIDNTIINANDLNLSTITFYSPVNTADSISSSNANFILSGFTITGGEIGVNSSASFPMISNCIISNNIHGIYGGSPQATNCTVVNNQGYGIYNCSGEISNSIIWGNGSGDLKNGSTIYSCADNNDSNTGNIDHMPYFVNASGGNYHLSDYSPCVDAGDPNANYSNEPAGGGGRINMGAYGNTLEATQASVDSDSDNLPDSWELLYWANITINNAYSDSDNDDANSLVEYHFGLNPNDDDTDNDAMTDKWEIDNNLKPLDGSDASKDEDIDGLTNLEEFNIGTNPRNSDSDNDGMPDNWEHQNWLNPNINDASDDLDVDGLTNIAEFNTKTDPNNFDCDNDGTSDGWEIDYSLDPFDSNDAAVDIDHDGLTNIQEYNIGTDPHDFDTDDDGMSDGWEVNYNFLNPLDSNDGSNDYDGDNVSNVVEFLHNSEPNDVNSLPEITTITVPLYATTIQQAIGWSIDGDTIEVLQGTYYESIDFNGMAVTIKSLDPNDIDVVEATVIDANGASQVVTFDSNEDSNSVLIGIKLVKGQCGVLCNASSPTIAKCVIEDSNSHGIYIENGSSPEIKNNIISYNGDDGIHVYDNNSVPSIKNNWIYCNENGVAYEDANSLCIVRNNTVVYHDGNGICVDSNTAPAISNCILWDNGDDLVNCSATYSCIETPADANGIGNITQEPLFLQELAADGSVDCRLQRTSLCKNAGDPYGNYAGEKDIENEERDVNGVDMGADEICEVHNTTQDIWYDNIQEAVDDAVSNDVIELREWTFSEVIEFDNKNLTLTSADPNNWAVIENTVIDAGGPNANVITYSDQDSNSVLTGLTITGGNYGIDCNNSSPVIRRCIVRDNDSHGVYCSASSPAISSNKIAYNSGSGIYVSDTASIPTVKSNWIYKNVSDGITFVNASSEAMVRNNTITENTGIGVNITISGDPNVSNCILWDNSSGELENCQVIYSCIKDTNVANGIGNITEDPLFVNTEEDNFALHYASPCIAAADPNADYVGDKDIYNNSYSERIEINQGPGQPKKLYVCQNVYYEGADEGDSWDTAYSSLTEAVENTNEGDMIYVSSCLRGYHKDIPAHYGVNCLELKRDLQIYGRHLYSSNTLSAIKGDILPGLHGGGNHVIVGAEGVVLDGLRFYGNDARGTGTEGCGAGMINYGCKTTVRNCIFHFNYAKNDGGAIYNVGHGAKMTLRDCIFEGNQAGDCGGAIANLFCAPDIDRCFFVENTAKKGGGIHTDTSPSISSKILSCVFYGNEATSDFGGGGMYNYFTDPFVVNCTFHANIAVRGVSIRNDLVMSGEFINSIMWDDYSDEEILTKKHIFNAVSYPSIDFCDIHGYSGSDTNFDSDPQFRNQDIQSSEDIYNGGLQLSLKNIESQECIDSGDNGIVEEFQMDTDISGEDRIQGDTVDLGAYEEFSLPWSWNPGRPVQFSDLVLSDHIVLEPQRFFCKVFEEDDNYVSFVEIGEYPDTFDVLYRAAIGGDMDPATLDGIAVPYGTELIIYSEPDFKGLITLDVKGPAVIVNCLWKNDSRYNYCYQNWSEPLNSEIPPEFRFWSDDPYLGVKGGYEMANGRFLTYPHWIGSLKIIECDSPYIPILQME